MNISDFGQFFSDGQKFENDVRGLVLAANHIIADLAFKELSDLATVEKSGRALMSIEYRSGAVLRFCIGSRSADLDRVRGDTFTHLFILGPCSDMAVEKAKTLLRTRNPKIKIGPASVVYA